MSETGGKTKKIAKMRWMEGSDWKSGGFYLRDRVIPGVYAFTIDGIVLFIGKSNNLLNTLKWHRANPWFRLHFKSKLPSFYWKESEYPNHDVWRIRQLYKPLIDNERQLKHSRNRLYRGKRRMKRRKGWNVNGSNGS